MARYALSSLLAIAASSTYVAAQSSVQFPAVPLASKHFAYPSGIPYQADTDTFGRGAQSGYNICNSTTENQDSLCQTSFIDHLDDFCLWAPSKPNSTIADTEGEEVAWCTKPGHGTRLIPAGALTGAQLLKAPDYILIAGFIDQGQINIQPGDEGGELDPHGQDVRGNPLGGLMYTNAYSSDNNTYQQMTEWNMFVGSGSFCAKICPDNAPRNDSAGYCRNTLDRLGCAYNAPNAAQDKVFEVCDSANMDLPGVYVSNGVTSTYNQPDESLGPITTVPYSPTIPASSNCVTFNSQDLYTSLPSGSGASSAAPTASGSKPSGSGGSSGAPSRSGSAGSAASTDSPGSAASTGVSVLAGVVSVAFSIVFLA